MSKQLKTDAALLKAMRKAAVHKMTAEEIREQRISFIMGTLNSDSGVTREKIERALEKQHGEKIV